MGMNSPSLGSPASPQRPQEIPDTPGPGKVTLDIDVEHPRYPAPPGHAKEPNRVHRVVRWTKPPRSRDPVRGEGSPVVREETALDAGNWRIIHMPMRATGDVASVLGLQTGNTWAETLHRSTDPPSQGSLLDPVDPPGTGNRRSVPCSPSKE